MEKTLQQNLNREAIDSGAKVASGGAELATENLVGKNIQLFEQCERRQQLDAKYGDQFTMDLEEEKQKMIDSNKAPRKPLSPYIFFSQEKRKVIKKEKGNEGLNAK